MKNIEELLTVLYGTVAAGEMEPRVRELCARYRAMVGTRTREPVDERTTVLITYGDQVREQGNQWGGNRQQGEERQRGEHKASPLQSLAGFLDAHAQGIVTGVHLLPFYPYSSDDGFSVMDYYAVDPALGTWGDVARVGEHFDLMFDAVINHASAQGDWFQRYLKDEAPYRDYFLSVPESFETARVIRPRALPLLTAYETAGGTRQVWTTFSADQIDLNYANPELILQILDVLLFYVAHGARMIRLDAIAFLWKESGTTCLHLPQTHAAIQLARAMLNEVAPDVILVTETNVPHADNISYFGDGTNEAQWVYNFALPPLTLHTLQTGDASKLAEWAKTLTTPSTGTTFFNFLASHDGIGLNPARGILTEDEIAGLVTRTVERGGLISFKNNSDGTTSPYEMNINYLDALTTPGEAEERSIARFVCAHGMMLALAGVPGIYFHSLFGSRGDKAGVEASGIARRINREKLERETLERELADPDSRRARVFGRMGEMLRVRQEHAAFHPQAAQTILEDDARVLAILRAAEGEWVLCLQNVTDAAVTFRWEGLDDKWRNLFTSEPAGEGEVELGAYEVAWLRGG